MELVRDVCLSCSSNLFILSCAISELSKAIMLGFC